MTVIVEPLRPVNERLLTADEAAAYAAAMEVRAVRDDTESTYRAARSARQAAMASAINVELATLPAPEPVDGGEIPARS